MKLLRAASFAIALLGSAFVAPGAWAAACVNGLVTATLAACDLKGGNVIFDITVDSLPVGSYVTFSENSTSFEVVFLPGLLGSGSGSSGSVTYTLTSTLNGLLVGTRLDSTASGGATVINTITPPGNALVSFNGSVVVAPLGGVAFLTVIDSYSLGSGASLTSFSNEFTLPEPGTLAIFGIGLAGLGLARRCRRRAA